MAKKKITIGFIGGGNMGGAIIAGICADYRVVVCEADKKRGQALKRKYNVSMASLTKTVEKSDVIVLAVKPQSFDSVLCDIKEAAAKDILVISIAAGITTQYIEKRLGKGARVIRTMPNLPVQVEEGMTGLCEGRYAKANDLILACRIFNNVGRTIVVKEKFLDAVTAVSGSGPAYVFYFAEILEKAARSLGLTDQYAKQLVEQTLKGSVRLLEKDKADAMTLRERVTSKGGTTEAALKVLKKEKVDKAFTQALKSAKKRARELSK